MKTVVPCPVCETEVPWVPESKWRPFCSERCRLLDLGDWLEGEQRIPADPELEGRVLHDDD